jgi:hypothetical protein
MFIPLEFVCIAVMYSLRPLSVILKPGGVLVSPWGDRALALKVSVIRKTSTAAATKLAGRIEFANRMAGSPLDFSNFVSLARSSILNHEGQKDSRNQATALKTSERR